MAAELVILVPIFVFFLLLIVALGRYTHSRQLVDDAAAAAARAASLASSQAQASTDAHQIATDTLRQQGFCQQTTVAVDLSAFRPGGQVTATVHCTATLSSLAMKGLPHKVTLSATSTSALETYRVLTP